MAGKQKARRWAECLGGVMHKFHLGQQVQYYPPRVIDARRGAYIVTATLPEREGEFEYRIRNLNEEHERMARESELQAFTEEKK